MASAMETDPVAETGDAGELYNGIGKGKLNKGQATGFGRGRGKGKLGQTTGKGKGISGASTKDRQKAVAQSRRAGLTFPVGRIHKMMKENLLHGARVSGTGAVYVAAVLEYLCAEILHIAMDAASDYNQKRISPRHLMLAIRSDVELDKFIKATIAHAGVQPHEHKPKSAKKEKKEKQDDKKDSKKKKKKKS